MLISNLKKTWEPWSQVCVAKSLNNFAVFYAIIKGYYCGDCFHIHCNDNSYKRNTLFFETTEINVFVPFTVIKMWFTSMQLRQKVNIKEEKMPICSQVFSEHGKRDISFFSFLSFFTHHFRLSIQPFHVGKVAVNRSFAVKLIPHEFYALDQWNFNPKKKIFFWSHSKVSSPSVNMMHVPFIHHCQIYGMLYKSSWPKYHG